MYDVVEKMYISLAPFYLPLKDHHKEIKNDDVIVLCQEGISERDRPQIKDRIEDKVVRYRCSLLVLAEVGGLLLC